MASFSHLLNPQSALLSCLAGISRFPQQQQQHKRQDSTNSTNSWSSTYSTISSSSHEMKPIEDYLASEFHKASAEERSKALEDLYCAGTTTELIDETSHVKTALTQLDLLLQQGNYPIYQAAVLQNRQYVQDPAFRLLFLRANGFDVYKATIQLIDFLEQKATYFGLQKVARDITLDDLSSEELDLILSGRYHIPDGTDLKGRVVLYTFSDAMSNCQDIAKVNRINYYIWYNILIANPVVQKKGLVAIYYDTCKPGEQTIFPGLDFVQKGIKFIASMPIRYSATHLCFKEGCGNAAVKNFVLGACLKGMPEYTRVRTAVHYGTDQEIQYQLHAKHGLPDNFPVDSCGNKRISNVWFHLHMANDPKYVETFNRTLVQEEDETLIESSEDEEKYAAQGDSSSSSSSDDEDLTTFASAIPTSIPRRNGEPNMNDVLLGRGRDIQNNPGNIYFREFLARYQDDYDRLARHKRGKLASDLLMALKARGIRFFQRSEDSDEWQETELRVAEKKVGQLLREFRKKKNGSSR